MSTHAYFRRLHFRYYGTTGNSATPLLTYSSPDPETIADSPGSVLHICINDSLTYPIASHRLN